jgi:hypothetical protein
MQPQNIENFGSILFKIGYEEEEKHASTVRINLKSNCLTIHLWINSSITLVFLFQKSNEL